MSRTADRPSEQLGPFFMRPAWRLTAEGIWILVLVIALFVLFGAGNSSSEQFLSERTIENLTTQLLMIGFLALPMALIMAAGGLDLSVGAVAGLVGIVVAQQLEAGVDQSAAITLGLLLALLIGLVNGLLTGLFRIHGALVTLGTMTLVRGISLTITDGRVMMVPNGGAAEYLNTLQETGVSLPWLILLALLVLLLAEFTPLGRHPQPRPGTSLWGFVQRVLVVSLPYVLSGLAAGYVGLILLGRLRTAVPTAGTGYEVQAVLAVAIGGTAIGGGLCNTVGAALGAIFVAGVGNLAVLTNLPALATGIWQGAILLVTGALTHLYYLIFSAVYRWRQAKTTAEVDMATLLGET